MGRPLDLVGERDGVVREADPTLPVRICEKLIGAPISDVITSAISDRRSPYTLASLRTASMRSAG